MKNIQHELKDAAYFASLGELWDVYIFYFVIRDATAAGQPENMLTSA